MNSGAAMAYYVVFPMAWKFFIGYESLGAGAGQLPIQLEAKVNEYLSLVMGLIFAFGLCFEMPVLLTLLNRVGLLEAKTLYKGRRYALVIILVIAAILTPPDVLSQLLLAVPMYLLYEASALVCTMQEKAKGKRQTAVSTQ
jgi:sec-independent protein translocase protein TatC